jgi:tetratricopeptide (TPR) repeat protein
MLLGCAASPLQTARDDISVSLQAMIDTAESLYRKGRQLHRDRRLNEAEQAYQRALTQDPGHLESHNAIAALNASRGDLDYAIGQLIALSDKHPEAAHVFANLGYAYYLNGQYRQSQDALERATMLDPDNANAWINLHKVRNAIARIEWDAHQAREVTLQQAPAAAVQIDEVMSGVYALRYPIPPEMPELTITAPLPHSRLAVDLPAKPSAVRRQATAVTEQGMPVAIVNGNGVTGLARALRGSVASDVWRVIRTENLEQFNVKTTRIEYDDSYSPAAQQLANAIGVTAELRPNYRQTGSKLRLVLGHDIKSMDVLRQRWASLSGQTVY